MRKLLAFLRYLLARPYDPPRNSWVGREFRFQSRDNAYTELRDRRVMVERTARPFDGFDIELGAVFFVRLSDPNERFGYAHGFFAFANELHDLAEVTL